ncbi:M20 aminoacylase family protein [Salinarimonas ramus]|uniref:Hippurate hydrolase n=1 Tax=Salinarimonas ramus TaxID=690164 RepID=A0A917V2T9_9HYPH|nr:M20 aminoacylase family protein [Salinarimonas ramus]GGK26154.1 hippurate hydrolase [Salinarimonas ramus]
MTSSPALLPDIAAQAETLTAWRRDFHANPEIGFEETRTAGRVAALLREWGVEVHEGIGGTGVVGVVRGDREGVRTIGLRADMDALPMEEATNLPYRSTKPGLFHGCGHDGHTTMLLGAARHLAQTRDFAGSVVLIFQPAEEGLGGARAMIADGLFERFPCDEVYALHNAPDLPMGAVGITPGAGMAGASFFDVVVRGRGGHGALPHLARDPVLVATAYAQAAQSVVARDVDPLEPAVLSITKIVSGAAYNVIPDEARLAGTLRYFSDKARTTLRERMESLAEGLAKAYGVEIELSIRDVFRVLENDEAAVAAAAAAAREVVGDALVNAAHPPSLASEDFADMLKAAPGAYLWLGHGSGVPLHNPGFLLDDRVLPIGASILARIVETRLA